MMKLSPFDRLEVTGRGIYLLPEEGVRRPWPLGPPSSANRNFRNSCDFTASLSNGLLFPRARGENPVYGIQLQFVVRSQVMRSSALCWRVTGEYSGRKGLQRIVPSRDKALSKPHEDVGGGVFKRNSPFST